MIRRLTSLALVVVGGVLLWPMPHSSRWDIEPDRRLTAGKTAYLEALGDRGIGEAPNVLLMVADDLGRFDVGYHGASPLATPGIDALARSGTVFVSAYATAAICAPSRAGLLTGRIQNRFGFESQPMQRYVRNRGEYIGFRWLIDTDDMRPMLLDAYPDAAQRARQGLPGSEITLPEIFQRLGHATAILGKWHLGYSEENHPLRFGFDTQYGFLEAFSLYADPEDPDIVEHRHDLFWERHIWNMGRSGPSAITRDGTVVQESRYMTDAILEETLRFVDDALENDRRFFAYVPFSAPHTPFQARREDYDALVHVGDHNKRVYLAMIRRLDRAVGTLVTHLRKAGVLDETLIIFTSDNGGAAYTGATDNGPLRGGKFTQLEGGLAVPLVISGPGFDPGRQEHAPVMLTDLFATLLGALDLPLPADRVYDSLDLTATDGLRSRRHLFWRSDFNRTVRAGSWKLMQDTRTGSVRLYDLAQDPGERNDLTDEHPDTAARLAAELDRWAAELAPPAWPRVMDYRYADELDTLWFAI